MRVATQQTVAPSMLLSVKTALVRRALQVTTATTSACTSAFNPTVQALVTARTAHKTVTVRTTSLRRSTAIATLTSEYATRVRGRPGAASPTRDAEISLSLNVIRPGLRVEHAQAMHPVRTFTTTKLVFMACASSPTHGLLSQIALLMTPWAIALHVRLIIHSSMANAIKTATTL